MLKKDFTTSQEILSFSKQNIKTEFDKTWKNSL